MYAQPYSSPRWQPAPAAVGTRMPSERPWSTFQPGAQNGTLAWPRTQNAHDTPINQGVTARSIRRAPSYAQIAQLPIDPSQSGFEAQGPSMASMGTPGCNSEQIYPYDVGMLLQTGPDPRQRPTMDMRRQSPPTCVPPGLLSTNSIWNAPQQPGSVEGWLDVPRAAGERSGLVVNNSLLPGSLDVLQSSTANLDLVSVSSSNRRSKKEIMSATSEHKCSSCGAGMNTLEGLR